MKFMKTPKNVDIAITDRCNLRCKYCSHHGSAGNVGNDLPKEEWLKFFEELNRCSVMYVCLQGGEPFYRDDLKDIIKGIVENRMRFSILSNGTLITEDMAEFLASTKRCNNVQVSIDGSNAEVHDSMCGKGSFAKAIEGIKLLKKHNVPVTVRVTIHKKNYMDLDNTAKLLLEELNLKSFSTNEASFFGVCRQNSEDVQLDIKELSITMDTLLRLNKKYNGRITAMAGPLAKAKYWIDMEEARKQGKEIPNRGRLVSCGCPTNKIAVRADGVIVPCILLSHMELGNINKDSLLDIWQNHPGLNRLRERRNIPLRDFEFCKACIYIDYCTGGCPALSYTALNDVYHPNSDSCLKRFLEEGGEIPKNEKK